MENPKEETHALPINAIKDLCVTGIFAAFVFVATMFINIRLPISINGGLIHMGNVPLIFASIVLGKKKGAIAGALGMTLFDLLSGWVLWAPFTCVIRAVMGYIIGAIAERKGGRSLPLNILAVLAGGVCMIAGYYLTEAILYHNLYTPLTSIPGNALQILFGAILGIPLASILPWRKVFKID